MIDPAKSTLCITRTFRVARIAFVLLAITFVAKGLWRMYCIASSMR